MQLDQLGRREFMVLLGGAAAWPQTLLAQTPRQRPLVSLLLYAGSENYRAFPIFAALLEGMRQHGQIEGRTFDLCAPIRRQPTRTQSMRQQVSIQRT